MTGKVLGFVKDDSVGTISGSDGKRYKFIKEEWKDNNAIQKGMEVDFLIDENRMAKEIFLLNDTREKSGWFSNMSRMEKYFWGVIALFMLLYIIANILIHLHQKTNIIDKPSPQKIERNNIKNSNRKIDKDLYNKIEILYGEIDKDLLKKDINNLDEKLNRIYDKYRNLIRIHVQFIDKVAFKGLEIDKQQESIDSIYSKIAKDSVIQKSKNKIFATGDNSSSENLINEIKNGYHEKMITVSERVQKIYITTTEQNETKKQKNEIENKLKMTTKKRNKPQEKISENVVPSSMNKKVENYTHSLQDNNTKKLYTNYIYFNIEQKTSIILDDMYKKIELLYSDIDSIFKQVKIDTIDSAFIQIHNDYKDIIKLHIQQIDNIAIENLDPDKYGIIIGEIYTNITNDLVIKDAIEIVLKDTGYSSLEKISQEIKHKYHEKFIIVSERVRKIYITTEKSMKGSMK